MKPQSLLGRFLVWRLKHIKHRQFMLILSVVVGFLSGLVALILKNATFFIKEFVEGRLINSYPFFYFIFPIVGLTIVYIINKYFFKQNKRRGMLSALFAIMKGKAIMERLGMYASLITAPLTVGLGGSVGLEGPAVGTSSSIGSNIGQLLRLNMKGRMLMVGCAAAGAIAAIFKAPIAGIIFAIEVFSLDLTFASLLPLLLATLSAVLTSIFVYGNEIILAVDLKDKFVFKDVPMYILLGVFCAFLSAYVYRCYFFILKQFDRINGRFKRLLIGGAIIGVMVFLIPPLYGEGFSVINNLLSGGYVETLEGKFFHGFGDDFYSPLLLLGGLLLFKVIATSVTIGAGGTGGIFAPTLFMGSTLGYMFSLVANRLGMQLSETNFTLVGMAGLVAGVLHAPLTAIFMIAELTGGYELFVPLMLTAAISYGLSRYFNSHSIYTAELAQQGETYTQHKDKAVLGLMSLEKIVEKNFSCIKPEMTLGEIVQVVAHSSRNIFPVVSDKGELLGVITLDDIRQIMFDHKLYDTMYAYTLMHNPTACVELCSPMDKVAETFTNTGAWNVAVVDKQKYVGFISKAKLFSVYRRMLLEFSEE